MEREHRFEDAASASSGSSVASGNAAIEPVANDQSAPDTKADDENPHSRRASFADGGSKCPVFFEFAIGHDGFPPDATRGFADNVKGRE